MKKHKSLTISLIATCILLAIMLTVSIAYNFLGGFYYCRVIEYNKVLGEKQTIEVTGTGAFVACCNFSGSLVINSNINQPVFIKTGNITEPLYVRAKCGIDGIDNQNGLMFGFVNWVQANDEYIYFNQPLPANQTLGLCNTISVDAQNQLKSSKNYVMWFIVEVSSTPFMQQI